MKVEVASSSLSRRWVRHPHFTTLLYHTRLHYVMIYPSIMLYSTMHCFMKFKLASPFLSRRWIWHPQLTMLACPTLYQIYALLQHTMLYCNMLSFAKWSWHHNLFKRIYLVSTFHYAVLYYTTSWCCTMLCYDLFYEGWAWHPDLTILRYTKQE